MSRNFAFFARQAALRCLRDWRVYIGPAISFAGAAFLPEAAAGAQAAGIDAEGLLACGLCAIALPAALISCTQAALSVFFTEKTNNVLADYLCSPVSCFDLLWGKIAGLTAFLFVSCALGPAILLIAGQPQLLARPWLLLSLLGVMLLFFAVYAAAFGIVLITAKDWRTVSMAAFAVSLAQFQLPGRINGLMAAVGAEGLLELHWAAGTLLAAAVTIFYKLRFSKTGLLSA